jgi:hypothetical protein
MMRNMKRVMALIMALAIMLTSTNVVFAAETEKRSAEDVNIEANSEEMEVDEASLQLLEAELDEIVSEITPREVVKVDILNKAGTTSSDLTLPFFIPSGCTGNVYIIACFKYSDGTTGNISVSCAQYSGTVPVDGTSRTLVSKGDLFVGSWAFKTSGVSKSMAYVVKIYAIG